MAEKYLLKAALVETLQIAKFSHVSHVLGKWLIL